MSINIDQKYSEVHSELSLIENNFYKTKKENLNIVKDSSSKNNSITFLVYINLLVFFIIGNYMLIKTNEVERLSLSKVLTSIGFKGSVDGPLGINTLCSERRKTFNEGKSEKLLNDISHICSNYGILQEEYNNNKVPMTKQEFDFTLTIVAYNLLLFILFYAFKKYSESQRERLQTLMIEEINERDLVYYMRDMISLHYRYIALLKLDKIIVSLERKNLKKDEAYTSSEILSDLRKYLLIHDDKDHKLPFFGITRKTIAFDWVSDYEWGNLNDCALITIENRVNFISYLKKLTKQRLIIMKEDVDKIILTLKSIEVHHYYVQLKIDTEHKETGLKEILEYSNNTMSLLTKKKYNPAKIIHNIHIVNVQLFANKYYTLLTEQLSSKNIFARIFSWFSVSFFVLMLIAIIFVIFSNMKFDSTIFSTIIASAVASTTFIINYLNKKDS